MTGNPNWSRMSDQEILDWMRPPGPQVDGLRAFCTRFVRPGMTVVEVGSFAGASSRILHEFLRGTGSLYCVDWFVDCWGAGNEPANEACERLFDQFVSRSGGVCKIRKSSAEAAQEFAHASVGLVYIDGNHEQAGEDIDLWLPKVRAGGVIAGHDYSRHWPDVVKSIDRRFGQPTATFIDSSWAVQL